MWRKLQSYSQNTLKPGIARLYFLGRFTYLQHGSDFSELLGFSSKNNTPMTALQSHLADQNKANLSVYHFAVTKHLLATSIDY